MRTRSLLPLSFQWDKIDEAHGVVSGSCLCGEVLCGAPSITETGSSIEFKCAKCARYIQLRASREIVAEGGAPGSAKKGG